MKWKKDEAKHRPRIKTLADEDAASPPAKPAASPANESVSSPAADGSASPEINTAASPAPPPSLGDEFDIRKPNNDNDFSKIRHDDKHIKLSSFERSRDGESLNFLKNEVVTPVEAGNDDRKHCKDTSSKRPLVEQMTS